MDSYEQIFREKRVEAFDWYHYAAIGLVSGKIDFIPLCFDFCSKFTGNRRLVQIISKMQEKIIET